MSKLTRELDNLVEDHGVEDVLLALSKICRKRAKYLASNQQYMDLSEHLAVIGGILNAIVRLGG